MSFRTRASVSFDMMSTPSLHAVPKLAGPNIPSECTRKRGTRTMSPKTQILGAAAMSALDSQYLGS